MRIRHLPAAMAVLCAAALTALPTAAADPPREVNVTTESTPGWVPAVEQEREARAAAAAFFEARDSGRYAEAYAMLSAGNRGESADAFATRTAEFNAKAGALKERRITRITWSKDPKSAPEPGVYAAVDFVGRFAGVDRYCGYLVLHQAAAGGPFLVMRQQEAFLDNATAAEAQRTQSQTSLALTWEQVAAASCPNYQPPPLEEAQDSRIGYPTVAAALAGLRKKAGVTFRTEAGWTVATETATTTIWTFAPAGHPAYPAVVRRQFRDEGGAVTLDMVVDCEATKAACDDLVREFQKLNDAMQASLRRPR